MRSGRGGVILAENQRPMAMQCVIAHVLFLRVGPSQSEALRVGMGGLACVSARSLPSSTRWYACFRVDMSLKNSVPSPNHPYTAAGGGGGKAETAHRHRMPQRRNVPYGRTSHGGALALAGVSSTDTPRHAPFWSRRVDAPTWNRGALPLGRHTQHIAPLGAHGTGAQVVYVYVPPPSSAAMT